MGRLFRFYILGVREWHTENVYRSESLAYRYREVRRWFYVSGNSKMERGNRANAPQSFLCENCIWRDRPRPPGLSTQTDNGHLPYSDVDSVDVGTTAPSTYQTLERNRFILDGKNPLPPENNPIYQGYAGLAIATMQGHTLQSRL